MKRKFWLLVLVGAVLLSAAPVMADEGFYVVAVGRLGTPITSLPKSIDTPGFYYLTGNLSYSGTSNGISVNSDDVTIDLMGFEIQGPGNNPTNYGIVCGNHKNVEIRNGCLLNWRGGLWSNGLQARALNLRINNCFYGILFDEATFGSYQIKGCSLTTSNASGSLAITCTGGVITGNTVITATSTFGIYISSALPCLVTQNSVSGDGIHFHSGGAGTVNVNNAF